MMALELTQQPVFLPDTILCRPLLPLSLPLNVAAAVQEIVLLQQQVQAHMDAFGEVKWEAMAAEQFGGRRHHHKLRTVYIMLQRAKVGDGCCYGA
jgi:hypothetical protein